MNFMAILERLKQPSSFAGYAVILVTGMQLIGQPIDVDPSTLSVMASEVFKPVGLCIAAVGGIIAIFKTEKPA